MLEQTDSILTRASSFSWSLEMPGSKTWCQTESPHHQEHVGFVVAGRRPGLVRERYQMVQMKMKVAWRLGGILPGKISKENSKVL